MDCRHILRKPQATRRNSAGSGPSITPGDNLGIGFSIRLSINDYPADGGFNLTGRGGIKALAFTPSATANQARSVTSLFTGLIDGPSRSLLFFVTAFDSSPPPSFGGDTFPEQLGGDIIAEQLQRKNYP